MKRIIQLTLAWLLVITSSQAYAQQVACTVNATANPDTVLCGDTINLTAIGLGGIPMINVNFNDSTAGSGWVTTAGVDFTNPCGGSGAAGTYLWMGDGTPAPRSLTTIPFDLSCGSTVCFDVRFAVQSGATPCEGPDLTNEGVFLQYSTNAGTSWTTIHYFDPDTLGSGGGATSPLTQWQNYCFQIPALTTTTQLRWAQTSVSGNNFDHWGLDNVQLFSNCGDPYSYTWEGIGDVQDTFVHQLAVDTSFVVSFHNSADTCYDTVSVHILPRPPLVASEDVALCDTVNAIDAQLTATGAHFYNWTIVPGGDPITSANFGCDSCANSWAHPSVTTTYVVSGDLTGICYETDSVTVDIVSAFDADFSFESPVCLNGGTVSLTPVTTGGIWTSTGIGLSSQGIFNPLLSGSGNIPITYTIPGACPNTQTLDIEVLALPDATIDAPTEYCFDADALTLSGATSGGIWSGQGIIDTVSGSFKPNILMRGNTIQVYYELNQPCFNRDTVDVFIKGSIAFIPSDTFLCNNETISLANNYIVSATNGGSGPIRRVFSGAGVTNQQNGDFDASGLTPGFHKVNLTLSDTFGFCAYTDSINVKVEKVDYANLIDSKYCDNTKGKVIRFDLPVNNSNTSFFNVAAGGNADNDTIQWLYDGVSFRFNPRSVGEGKWGFEITHTNINGCVGKSTDTIFVFHAPSKPLPIDNEVCEGTPYSLLATGGNNDSLYWASNTSNSSGSFLGFGSPVKQGDAPDASSGNIVVYVKEVNDICQSQYQKVTIPVRPSPKTNYYRDYLDTLGVQQNVVDLAGEDLQGKVSGVSPFRVVFSAENVVLEDLNLGKKEDSLIWVVYGLDLLADTVLIDTVSDQGTTTPELQVIEYLFNEPTYAIGTRRARPYIMELTHYNEFGCFRKVSSLVDVKGVEQVPNVFTPNGDGVNDFLIINAPTKEFDVKIFNRWGKVIHQRSSAESNRVSTGYQIWDGSGVKDGTYFFIIEGEYADGSLYKEKGTVTIVGTSN